MCLLFNILSRLVITFLPRSESLLISWLKSPSACDFGAPQNKIFCCFHCFPIYLPWSDGTRCHGLIFKIKASNPITSWQAEEEKVEAVVHFIFLGSKIIADGDCSHEIKRRLLLWRKAMTNLDSILKSRHITLLTNVPRVKATLFPVVKFRSKSWTIKKTECWRIDAF